MFDVDQGESLFFCLVDKQWYRGIILDHVTEKTASVLYVDYGNSEIVSVENMREMKEEWMAVPKMVLQIILEGKLAVLQSII